METNRRLLSRRDVAELFRVTTRTIDRMRASGTLPPPIKIADRTFRWESSAIEQFLIERGAVS